MKPSAFKTKFHDRRSRCSAFQCQRYSIRQMLYLVTLCFTAWMAFPLKCNAQDRKSLRPIPAIRVVLTRCKARYAPETVLIGSLRGRKITNLQTLTTFPAAQTVYVSPSAHYVLWDDYSLNEARPTLLVRKVGQPHSDKRIWQHDSRISFRSWSPTDQMALFINVSEPNDQGLPRFTVVDPVTASFVDIRSTPDVVRSAARRQILDVFWSRDNTHLILSAIDWGGGGSVGTTKGLGPLPTQNYYAVSLHRTHRLILGKPYKVSEKEINVLAGPALLPLLKAWEDEKLEQGEFNVILMEPVILTADGNKGFLFGDAIRVRNPDWAPPDRLVTYISYGSKVKRGLTEYNEVVGGPTWTSDGKAVMYLNSFGFLEMFNPVDGRTSIVNYDTKLGAPLQLLP